MHLTEGEREVEGRVVHRAEVGVGARFGATVLGDDGEVDLFTVGHDVVPTAAAAGRP